MKIELPYGKDGKVNVEIPEENLLGIIEPKEIRGLADLETKIKDSMRNPVGSKRLSGIIKPEDNVVIVVTDITRPCPDNKLVPVILDELHDADVRDEQVTILIATGMHRPMTKREIIKKLGKDVYERVEVINHVCTDTENLVFLGKTPNLGIPLWVNKVVADADVRISTGMVDTHIFAGYAGGGKSIMPGVSGLETIENMHRTKWLDNPLVGICNVDNNPVRLDIDEAAKKADLHFVVNVILNGCGEVALISAGDPIGAHRELAKAEDKIVKVPISELPDIVISAPGYPKDRDLYQATRAANNFVCGIGPAIKKGGVIIIPATCQDGTGSNTFYEWMKNARDIDEIIERGKTEIEIGSHRPYIMAKILKWADVIIVGSRIPHIVEEMKMIAAETIDEALEIAVQKTNDKAKMLVSPHGLTTVPIFTV